MSSPSFIYLDNNATTRPLPEVIETVARVMHDGFANPGSRHAAGRRARRVLEDSRESIAGLLGADPREVIFTSGGTESINLALFGLARGTPGVIATTAGEHPATVETCRTLAARGWRTRDMAVDSEGLLLTEGIDRWPWDEIKLATVILAHNETGVIQDLQPLADECRQRNVPWHIDAVQAVGKIPVNFHTLGATALSLGAHKFYGPRGIGALLLRQGTRLVPLLHGGHQEQERRPGTEATALIAGMAKALEVWSADYERRTSHVRGLRDRLEAGLLERCAPAAINGDRVRRLPNTLNIAFPGLDGEALLVALDLEGIGCSLGSTCASGSAEPAPALVAMNRPPEVIRASVRFSLGIENTEAEIDDAITRIARVVERLRSA
ncbi:MAG TPA: cysteine desulfurase family protein [Planctomycetaceae bacterium]|nr:cysteine desulfurase family protein [Planctomycetaceae bacterium]